MKERTAKRLKRIGFCIIALGVVYGALHIMASRALRREMDALRAEGRPMRASELIPPEIPSPNNAAILYGAAIQMLKAEPLLALAGYTPPAGRSCLNLCDQLEHLASDVLDNPTNTLASDHLRQLLQDKRVVEALAVIDRGTARAGCRNDLDYSQRSEILVLSHLASYRSISRILSAAARQQAADGDSVAAWRTAMTGLRFANALENEPLLISQLVRIIQLQLAGGALRSVAAMSPPSAKDDAELQNLLSAFESGIPLVRALDGERLFFGEWAYNVMTKGYSLELPDEFGGRKHFFLLKTAFHPLVLRDHAAYLHIMHAYTRNAAAPLSKRDALLGDQLLSEIPRYCVLSRMITPNLSAIGAKAAWMTAEARVLRVSLAAIRYRQEKGTYPSDLQTLNAPDIEDPFTGKPLLFRPAAAGFIIYSVGKNQIDDGGAQQKDSKADDIAWRYEEVSKASPAK